MFLHPSHVKNRNRTIIHHNPPWLRLQDFLVTKKRVAFQGNDDGMTRVLKEVHDIREKCAADEAATVLLKIKLQKIGHSRHCREPFLALGYNV